MSSIKKNFFYSSILTVSGYLFPLIVYPYITRVLGVANIGACNFVDSIVDYFILFSMLGIATVGIREVAAAKGDPKVLKLCFNRLFSLNILITSVFAIIYVVLLLFLPQFQDYRGLMSIGLIKLLFNTLLVEWFYKGLEQFKYITIRSVAVKFIYVVCVFLFVKNTEDFYVYYLLTAMMFVINALLNIKYIYSFTKIELSFNAICTYLKPVVNLGLYMLLTSMYISFNVIFLGLLSGDMEVGYYTSATKIYIVLLSVFTAFTGVMIPKLSFLVAEKRWADFNSLVAKSYDFLLGFSIPVIILAVVFAPQIISIVCGSGYEGAILPLRIIMPLIAIVGYEQILILQILVPLKKDRAMLINSLIGAIVALSMNFFLVPVLQSVGSALVWVASELMVLISAQYFVFRYTKFKLPYEKIMQHLVFAVPPLMLCLILHKLDQLNIFTMVLSFFINLLYYAVIHVKYLKNDVIIELFLKLRLIK